MSYIIVFLLSGLIGLLVGYIFKKHIEKFFKKYNEEILKIVDRLPRNGRSVWIFDD